MLYFYGINQLIVPSESLFELKANQSQAGGGRDTKGIKELEKGRAKKIVSNPPPPAELKLAFSTGFIVIGDHLCVSEPLCAELVYFFRITPSRICKIC
jgi:hypothetical protein